MNKNDKIATIKKISKYVVNFLNMLNFAIVMLSPIWNWQLDNITKEFKNCIISTYLVSGKLFDTSMDAEEIKGVG